MNTVENSPNPSPRPLNLPGNKELGNGFTAEAHFKQGAKQLETLSKIAAASENSIAEAVNQMGKQQGEIQEAVRLLNEKMRSSQKNLSFNIDQISNRIVVAVVDQVSGEVVRQIPAESIIKFAHTIESMKGVLFEEML